MISVGLQLYGGILKQAVMCQFLSYIWKFTAHR